jgi:hypothetical protein
MLWEVVICDIPKWSGPLYRGLIWTIALRYIMDRWMQSTRGKQSSFRWLGSQRKEVLYPLKSQNMKPWCNLSRRSKGEHGPLIWLHFVFSDTRSWRSQWDSRQKWKIMKRWFDWRVVIVHGHISESWREELVNPRSISAIATWRVDTLHRRSPEVVNHKALCG